MNFSRIVVLALAAVTLWNPASLQAQDILKPKFGLFAGANLTTMFGPAEEGVTENHKLTIQITAGATVKLPLHERFGLTAGVSFVQRGSIFSAESNNSFLKLPAYGAEQPIAYGYTVSGNTYTKRTDKNYRRRKGINVVNGYIEVPVLFYAEAIDNRLEFEFGASIGFLVSSEGLGTIKFGDEEILNVDNPKRGEFIEVDLDHKYIIDDIGTINSTANRSSRIDGTTRYYPNNLGAYYLTDEPTRTGDGFYRTVDVGLQAGISYYFTPGLRLGTRFYYGLTDVTNTTYDYSFQNLNSDGTYIQRNDFDRNFGCQIFVGLQF